MDGERRALTVCVSSTRRRESRETGDIVIGIQCRSHRVDRVYRILDTGFHSIFKLDNSTPTPS